MLNETEIDNLVTHRVNKVYNKLREEQKSAEKYYELDFQDEVPLPDNVQARCVIPNSAREKVDLPLSYLLSGKIVASQPPKAVGEQYDEDSNAVTKFLNGWINMLLKEDPSPPYLGLFFSLLRGEHFWKVTYNTEAMKSGNFPLNLVALEPSTVYPAQSRSPRLIPSDVLEVYERPAGEIRETWEGKGNLVGLSGKGDNDPIKWVEYCSEKQYGCKAGDEWVRPLGKNPYGFMPYVHAYSGLGGQSINADPEKLARSIIYPFKHLLILQARLLSQIESIIDWATWPMLITEGPLQEDWKPKVGPGAWLHFKNPGSKGTFSEGIAPSPEIFAFYALITSIIEGGGSTAALRGAAVGRSGLQQEAAAELGRADWDRVKTNFENSLAVALGIGLMMIEKVIGESIGIKTMEVKDEKEVFNEVSLSPKNIRNYYTCNVKLVPDDETEAGRRKALGADLRGRGSISWLRELMEYHGMTRPEADEEINRTWAERLVSTDPSMAQGMGYLGAKELGMLGEIQEIQAATQGEELTQQRLGKRTGAIPTEGQPATPTSQPSAFDYFRRRMGQRGR